MWEYDETLAGLKQQHKSVLAKNKEKLGYLEKKTMRERNHVLLTKVKKRKHWKSNDKKIKSLKITKIKTKKNTLNVKSIIEGAIFFVLFWGLRATMAAKKSKFQNFANKIKHMKWRLMDLSNAEKSNVSRVVPTSFILV